MDVSKVRVGGNQMRCGREGEDERDATMMNARLSIALAKTTVSGTIRF